MDSVILLSVLPFSDGEQVGVSVIFVLFVLESFTPNLSGIFKLTTNLESIVPVNYLNKNRVRSLVVSDLRLETIPNPAGSYMQRGVICSNRSTNV